jgi:hypothetical protein
MWVVCVLSALLAERGPVQAPVRLLPVPQQVAAGEGAYDLGEGCALWIAEDAAEPDAFAAQECARLLAAKTGAACWVSRGEGIPRNSAVVHPVDVTNPAVLQVIAPEAAESYAISVMPGQVEVRGHDDAGFFYGLQTLVQLAARKGEGWIFPALSIRDWPDYAIRGVDIAWVNPARVACPDPEYDAYEKRNQTGTAAALIDQIRTLARFKVNTVFWNLGRNVEFKLHPELNSRSRLSQEEVRRVVAEAAKVHVTVIPMMNSFAHVTYIAGHPSYAHLSEDADATRRYMFCPSEPEVPKLLDDLYGEVCDLIPGSWFHIGCDETTDFTDERCLARAKERGWIGDDGKITAQGRSIMYAEHVAACAQLLRKRGRRAMIWADKMNADVAKAMPKDVVLTHWYYGQQADAARIANIDTYSQYDSIVGPAAMANGSGSAYLVPLTEYHRKNIKLMCEKGKGKSMGVCVTSWPTIPGPPQKAFWNGFLCGAEYMWSAQAPHDDADFGLSFARNFYGYESPAIGTAWDLLGSVTRFKSWPWKEVFLLGGDPDYLASGPGAAFLTTERATELLDEVKRSEAAIDEYVKQAADAGVDLTEDESIAFLRHSARVYRHIAHKRLWWPKLGEMTDPDRKQALDTLRSEAEALLADVPRIWGQARPRMPDPAVECWQKVYRKTLQAIDAYEQRSPP